MKKLATLTCLIFLTNFIFAQNLKALDEKNGFREYKFGNDTLSVPNLIRKIYDDESEEGLFIKQDEKLKIGDAELESIEYHFSKNRLYSVEIKTKPENGKDLLDIMEYMYGKGVRKNNYQENYLWGGDSVVASYQFDPTDNSARLRFISIVIYNKVQSEKENKLINSKGDM